MTVLNNENGKWKQFFMKTEKAWSNKKQPNAKLSSARKGICKKKRNSASVNNSCQF